MLIPRSVLSKAAMFCSSDATRLALWGVQFSYHDGKPIAVATDGRRMTVFSWDDIESPLQNHEHPDFDPVVIAAEDCKRMAKLGGYKPAIMKKPYANHVALVETPEPCTVLFKATDLENVSEASCKPVEGRFPRWDQVLPDTNEYHTVTVSRKFLIEALQALEACTEGKPKDEDAVQLHVDVRGPDHALIVGPRYASEISNHCIIMPMGNDPKDKTPPQMWHPTKGWIKVTSERQLSSSEAMDAFMAATAREKAAAS